MRLAPSKKAAALFVTVILTALTILLIAVDNNTCASAERGGTEEASAALSASGEATGLKSVNLKAGPGSKRDRADIDRAILLDRIERRQVKPPELTDKDYRSLGPVKGRTTGWFLAQLHLWFAAFVLAVPIFVVISEAIGMITGNERYDRMAYEFLRISMTAYSFTAISGILFAFALFFFYPGLMKYMTRIFEDSYVFYVLFIFLENAALYSYYYGWKRMRRGTKKKFHLMIGLWLNVMGTLIMITANAWATFMMTPGGVDMAGIFQGGVWAAINNPLWHPMNLHRFVANIAYGGSIVAAYAAYMFLSARTRKERAHYDWMGYTASYIAVIALLPLPFAGYWLTAEIYAYSQQMGITLMGGLFGWIFVIQAVIIGALFLSINYYLWCAMERNPGGERYTVYIKYLGFVILACFLVWFTPHTLILTQAELMALGGPYHPILGPLGLMPAKNIAVNILIIATYISFLLYRRSGRRLPAGSSKAELLGSVQLAVILSGAANIIFLGVYYGYFTNSVYKVASSVPQVMTTLSVIVLTSGIEYYRYKGVRAGGRFGWGRVPERSQYALILLAVSFTWLMGLMGFVRSAIRQHWHVFSVVRDASPEAYTPTISYAAQVVSIATIVFISMMVLIFRLNRGSGEEGGGRL